MLNTEAHANNYKNSTASKIDKDDDLAKEDDLKDEEHRGNDRTSTDEDHEVDKDDYVHVINPATSKQQVPSIAQAYENDIYHASEEPYIVKVGTTTNEDHHHVSYANQIDADQVKVYIDYYIHYKDDYYYTIYDDGYHVYGRISSMDDHQNDVPDTY